MKNNTQLLQTRFPDELVSRIDTYRKKHGGLTRSEFLRRAAETQLATLSSGVTVGPDELDDIDQALNELSTLLYGVKVRAVTEGKQ